MQEEILISKLCNAFLPDAMSELVVDPHSGFWVGGRLSVTRNQIDFSQNAMNSAVHTSDNDLTILYTDIRSVHRKFGFATGIIVVETNTAEYKFRCYGAKTVAARLDELIQAKKQESE